MKALKILLDTSFLLPIVGVKVEGDVDDLLKRLWVKFRNREVEIYYTELNLLEISWILSRRAYDPRIVAQGLLSIERNFIKCPVTPHACVPNHPSSLSGTPPFLGHHWLSCPGAGLLGAHSCLAPRTG